MFIIYVNHAKQFLLKERQYDREGYASLKRFGVNKQRPVIINS